MIRYRFSDLTLSARRRLLLREGREAPLIPRYFDLLVLLVEPGCAMEFIDLTDQVEALTAEAGIQAGLVNIQSLHTTTAIVVNEHEPRAARRLRHPARGSRAPARVVLAAMT